MTKIAAVILNYNNIDETVRCIEEFKAQKENLQLVVVDNNSIDESHQVLSKRKDIYYIQTYENLGYAKGNNVGIEYILKNMDVDLIIISNNDIHFANNSTLTIIKETIKKIPTNWGYLGTVIKDSNGHLAQYYPNKHTTFLERIVNSSLFGVPFRKFFFKKDTLEKGINNLIESEIVSGAFFILNPNAVKKIGAFDPYTFLYGEERILAKKYYNSGYKGYITRDVFVEHENSATTKRYPTISYVNSLKSEYYYFIKYKSFSKAKETSLVSIRLIDTLIRVIIGNLHKETFLKTLKMYLRIKKELK
ncbi:glycosyltransferase family 2 protein [Peribacillus butanolivorans]|uniref:glycosyltransferase family 2 protein n=1 Tax=Peribacillus butanolivorans TaxID=421767 RepID=UPI0036D8DA68